MKQYVQARQGRHKQSQKFGSGMQQCIGHMYLSGRSEREDENKGMIRDFGPSLFIAFNSDLCYYSSRAVPFGQRFFETR